MDIPFLFKIKLWVNDPSEYILAYGKDENDARSKASGKLRYNCGMSVEGSELTLVTVL